MLHITSQFPEHRSDYEGSNTILKQTVQNPTLKTIILPIYINLLTAVFCTKNDKIFIHVTPIRKTNDRLVAQPE
jgi:hypothetical protein